MSILKHQALRGLICSALRDLVPFVQFKKREKHLWRSVNFSKVAGFSLYNETAPHIMKVRSFLSLVAGWKQ